MPVFDLTYLLFSNFIPQFANSWNINFLSDYISLISSLFSNGFSESYILSKAFKIADYEAKEKAFLASIKIAPGLFLACLLLLAINFKYS